MKCLLLVGLLLSEVLFGGIMFLGIARGLGLPSDGLGLELFTTTCCSCYFVLHLMRFFFWSSTLSRSSIPVDMREGSIASS